ncbi:adaptin, alpha/gamma/epsilon, putative [Entamoeba invadens IP1]|uniref:Adaptin, alpha/gamma/epsilon, putative n=1 Tax=Entamoeba invadens IP1 TaxID=370355 RepID=A0A0A1U772_ENTIV|nr:adaptin, alpha/gamma/epsilon, putative [Entamoeba invadens IP1]ELP90170.1 adaptin, alpha/gamma/epsilon, putative [Entamoeba invadens IP1]|eukprot:XP_004256941.1 adaptin, alpha/gamma/epsilon, putative [Entamoeba invadens IP1]
MNPFSAFVHDIGEKHTVDEEHGFVSMTLKSLGNGLDNTNPSAMKEYIKKMLVIYELGYNVEQSVFMIINTTQHQNSLLQKTALVACSAMISTDSEFTLLLTNSLTKLLLPTSPHPLFALRIVSRFLTPTTMPAYTTSINLLLKSKDQNVRAAAIRSLYKMYLMSDKDVQPIIKSALSFALVDSSVLVVESSVPIITQIMSSTIPENRIWPGLIDIVSRNLLMFSSYDDMKKVPAQLRGYILGDTCGPFFQVKLLKLLRVMNPTNTNYQQTIFQLLTNYRKMQTRVGIMLQVEAIKTAMFSIATDRLVKLSANIGADLFRVNDLLVVYCGLNVMKVISEKDPTVCRNNITTISEFVKNPNEVVAIQAIKLLKSVVSSEDAVSVVLSLLDIAKSLKNDIGKGSVRNEILKVSYYLCSQFTPDFQWYCSSVCRILLLNSSDQFEVGIDPKTVQTIYKEFIDAMKSDNDNFEIALQCVYDGVNVNKDETTLSLCRLACRVISESNECKNIDIEELKKTVDQCAKIGAVEDALLAALRLGYTEFIEGMKMKEQQDEIVVVKAKPQNSNLLNLNFLDIPVAQETEKVVIKRYENAKDFQVDVKYKLSINTQQRVNEISKLNELGISYKELENDINETVVDKQILISQPFQLPKKKKIESNLRFDEYQKPTNVSLPFALHSQNSEGATSNTEDTMSNEVYEAKQEQPPQYTNPVPNTKRWNFPKK